MAAEKICFKDYIQCKDDKNLSKTRKKINRKRKDGSSKNVYGWAGYGPPPNISGAGSAPAAGADGGGAAVAGGGVGESYELADTDNSQHLRNVYKYGKSRMKFLDYLKDENEEFDDDIDPVEPVGGDPKGETEEFDDDTYELIRKLEDEGLSIEEIADEVDFTWPSMLKLKYWKVNVNG